MSVLNAIHGGYVHKRRVGVLSKVLAALLPPGASVLDVGCGDGALTLLMRELRPDISIEGVDVLLRPDVQFPVRAFDGSALPYLDGAFDVVMFVDVLHHTMDPMVLLCEAARVTRHHLLLKDHARQGFLAGTTLRFMDRVGNARHGVQLPYNYWPLNRWHQAFAELHFRVDKWHRKLGLYPFPANLAFERSLHFIALLSRQAGA